MWSWLKSLFRRRKVASPKKPLPGHQVDGPGLKAQIKMRGFTPRQERKLLAAVNLMLEAINSQDFKDWCLHYQFEPIAAYYPAQVVQSTADIYATIMSGDDLYGPADKDVDIDVTLYSSRRSVIGYTYQNTMRTWLNSKYFIPWSLRSPESLAGNIIHEACHNMGYGHAYKFTPTRYRSVPYAVGYAVRRIAKRIRQG